MRLIGRFTIVLLVATGLITSSVAIGVEDTKGSLELSTEKEMVSEFGIQYKLYFNNDGHNLTIEATNPTSSRQYSGVSVTVDGATIRNTNHQLGSGETSNTTIKIQSALNALETSHEIRVSTYGAARSFTFTREIDATNSTTVPTPYIADTSVSSGSIDGEKSVVVNITVTNPSDQRYPTKLMVHTSGTDGSLYLPTADPGESTNVTVELLDDPDSVVVGEARLYAYDLNDSSGGIDQVGFEGRVNGTTSTWNESYTAIEGPWSEDAYRYENSSVDRPGFFERASDGNEVGGVPVVVPGVAFAALLGLAFLVRRAR